jgi:hypothetical protein
MATAKWSTLSARTNVTLSSVNGLANGSTSGLMTYDNSTLGDMYALVEVALGSITPTTGGSLTLRVYPTANAGAVVPDDVGAIGGGESYTLPVTTSATAKVLIFRIGLLAKVSHRLQITNNMGVAISGASNTINVTGYNEEIA